MMMKSKNTPLVATINKTASSKKKLLTSAVLLSIGGFASSANADLSSGSLGLVVEGNLNPACVVGGTYPDCTYGAFDTADAGSFFTMDGNPGGAIDGGLTTIDLVLPAPLPLVLDGSAQSFNGTPISLGNTYIGDNVGPIATWDFFGSIGTNTHAGLTVGGGDTTIDMSTWEVNWGEVAIIDMGGDPNQGDTSIAALVCTGGIDASCELGDTFTLDYSAHVPVGDPSGFGGVLYGLHLEGTIGTLDETPDDFGFTTPAPVVGNTVIISDAVTVTGMVDNNDVAISVSTGNTNEYCIGDDIFCDVEGVGANFTSTAGVIQNGNTVYVRHTSTATFDASTVTTLTIGGVDGTFTTITESTFSTLLTIYLLIPRVFLTIVVTSMYFLFCFTML